MSDAKAVAVANLRSALGRFAGELVAVMAAVNELLPEDPAPVPVGPTTPPHGMPDPPPAAHLPNGQWESVRGWRNNNPGNLRPLPLPEAWGGQTRVDAGGYSVFSSRMMGWRALAMNILAYQRLHGIKTMAALAARWAPPADGNDPRAYAGGLSAITGYPIDTDLPFDNPVTLTTIAGAIARLENGSMVEWPNSERDAGIQSALGRGWLELRS